LKAGIPYSTPLNSGSGHKDSLSRLGNAMQLFRKQIRKKIDLANESIGFKNTVGEVIARSKNLHVLEYPEIEKPKQKH